MSAKRKKQKTQTFAAKRPKLSASRASHQLEELNRIGIALSETCDVDDALSATDRPYTRAVPTDKALDILKLCVREAEVDPELFRLFVEAQDYRVAVKS